MIWPYVFMVAATSTWVLWSVGYNKKHPRDSIEPSLRIIIGVFIGLVAFGLGTRAGLTVGTFMPQGWVMTKAVSLVVSDDPRGKGRSVFLVVTTREGSTSYYYATRDKDLTAPPPVIVYQPGVIAVKTAMDTTGVFEREEVTPKDAKMVVYRWEINDPTLEWLGIVNHQEATQFIIPKGSVIYF